MAMTAPPARRWVSALIAPWSVLSRPLRYGSTGSSLRPVPEVLTKRVSNVLRRSCAPGAPGWCAGRGDRLTFCEQLARADESRMPGWLTAEDLAAIAAALPGGTAAELARALGRPYHAVHRAVQRMR